MNDELERMLAAVPSLDAHAMAEAGARLDDLTKPLGSLGRLEALLVLLAGMTAYPLPSIRQPGAIVFAADHGVSEAAVSAYEPTVTEEMAVNMVMGGAVSSVLARASGTVLRVVDVGVRGMVRHPAVVVRKVAHGTANFVLRPAMTREQAVTAVLAGAAEADELLDLGCDLLIPGEMGIGNTTSAAALCAAMLDLPVEEVVGRGTGIGDRQYAYKIAAVKAALMRRRAPGEVWGAWEAMTELGGFEIAAMAGAMIAAARRRAPIVLDGAIAGTAALFACRLQPRVRDFLIAAHRSAEPLHGHVLAALDLRPLVEWGMRLGEGSGALLLAPMIRSACAVLAQTATFADARVTNPHRKDAAAQAASTGLSAPSATAVPKAADFSPQERAAVYRVIDERRDIRAFLPQPLPSDALQRILLAAHHGPSVGYMQPWNFVVVQDRDVLIRLQEAVERERVRAALNYDGLQREYYLRLKVEGILQAPVTVCVTNDGQRAGPHVLGRNTIPETDLMSTACAIENMWLAARVENIAMGWVSMYDKQDVREILGVPQTIDPVALLTFGYTAHFPDIPGLERVGWRKRMELADLVFTDRWNDRSGELVRNLSRGSLT